MSSEKYGLETGALNQFAEAFALEHGEGRFTFHELRSPPEPDGLCSLDGQTLHVEVGHVYGEESDAKRLLGRTGKSAATLEQRMRTAMMPLDGRLLMPLNSLLASKATKTYQTSRVWLLIRSASPLWGLEDFKEHQASLAIPPKHPFEQIWLLSGPRASFGVLRLA